MVDILNTWALIFTDNSNNVQILFSVLFHILGFSDHKACKNIARSLIQCPFHQDKGWLIGSKIAFK